MLWAKLDDFLSKSTVWKAKANGMIVQLTNDLKEKDASFMELQNSLENRLNEEQRQQQLEPSSTWNESLVEQIAQLKLALP